MWKIIKTWLPPKSVEKIKFIDKKSVVDFVPQDQQLIGWGGKDEYDGTFVPEVKDQAQAPTQQVANGDVDAKKVRFYSNSNFFVNLILKILNMIL